MLSRDAAISALGRVIAAPCSTVDRRLATEVRLEPGDDPVRRPCLVQLDSAFGVPVANLTSRLGRLSGVRMQQICSALATAVDCRCRCWELRCRTVTV